MPENTRLPVSREQFIRNYRELLPPQFRAYSDDALLQLALFTNPELAKHRFSQEPITATEAFTQPVKEFAYRTPESAAGAFNSLWTLVDPEGAFAADRIAFYEMAKGFSDELVAEDKRLQAYHEWAGENPFNWEDFFTNPKMFNSTFSSAVTSMGTILAAGVLGGPAGALGAAFVLEGGEAYKQAYERAKEQGYTEKEIDRIAGDSALLYGIASAGLEVIVPLTALRSMGFIGKAAKSTFGKISADMLDDAVRAGGKVSSASAGNIISEYAVKKIGIAKRIQSALGAMLPMAGTEALTEGAQYLTQEAIIDQKVDKKDITFDWLMAKMATPEFNQSIAGGLVAGGGISAITTVPARAFSTQPIHAANMAHAVGQQENGGPAREAIIDSYMSNEKISEQDKIVFSRRIVKLEGEQAAVDIGKEAKEKERAKKISKKIQPTEEVSEEEFFKKVPEAKLKEAQREVVSKKKIPPTPAPIIGTLGKILTSKRPKGISGETAQEQTLDFFLKDPVTSKKEFDKLPEKEKKIVRELLARELSDISGKKILPKDVLNITGVLFQKKLTVKKTRQFGEEKPQKIFAKLTPEELLAKEQEHVIAEEQKGKLEEFLESESPVPVIGKIEYPHIRLLEWIKKAKSPKQAQTRVRNFVKQAPELINQVLFPLRVEAKKGNVLAAQVVDLITQAQGKKPSVVTAPRPIKELKKAVLPKAAKPDKKSLTEGGSLAEDTDVTEFFQETAESGFLSMEKELGKLGIEDHMPFDAVLDILANSSRVSPGQRNLARRLLKYSGIRKLKFGFINIPIAGLFDESGIYLTKRRTLSDPIKTVLHEAIHAVTVKGLLSSDSRALAIRARLRKLLDHVANTVGKEKLEKLFDAKTDKKKYTPRQRQAILNKYYGLISDRNQLAEFVAESFSNPEFQKLLDSILLPDSFAERGKTLFEKIVNIVKRLLGIPAVSEGVLGKVLRESISLMELQEEIAQKEILTREDNQSGAAHFFKEDSMLNEEDAKDGTQSDEQQLDPGAQMDRFLLNNYGVMIKNEDYPKLIKYARDNKDVSFLNTRDYLEYEMGFTDLIEKLTKTKIEVPDNIDHRFHRELKLWHQKTNSRTPNLVVKVDKNGKEIRPHVFSREDVPTRFNLRLRGRSYIGESSIVGLPRLEVQGVENLVTGKKIPEQSIQNFMEEDKLNGNPLRLFYLNDKDITIDVLDASNKIQFITQNNQRIQFTSQWLHRTNQSFGQEYKDGKFPFLRFFLADKGGDNSKIILAAADPKVAGFNREEFINYLKEEIGKGNIKKSHATQFLAGADFQAKAGNIFAFGQEAGLHEAWKNSKGRRYLLRVKNISDLFKRFRLDLFEGYVARGVGESSIMIIDSSEVIFEHQGKEITPINEEGRYIADGFLPTSEKYLQKLNKVTGNVATEYKTVIRELGGRDENGEYNDYIAIKMMEMKVHDDTFKIWKVTDGTKELIAEYKNKTWLTPDGQEIDRIASLDEVKDRDGRFGDPLLDKSEDKINVWQERGLYQVHTLAETATRVLFTYNTSATEGAHPTKMHELAMDNALLATKAGKKYEKVVREHYRKIIKQYMDRLFGFAGDPKSLRDFVLRKLQKGELPTELDRIVKLDKTGKSILHANYIKQLLPSLNNRIINDGMYKLRQPGGMATKLLLKPQMGYDVSEGSVFVSADNKTIKKWIISKMEIENPTIADINSWLEENEFHVLVHRQPILGIVNVQPRRVYRLVEGQGETIFVTDSDVFHVHEGDFDGDTVFAETFENNELIDALYDLMETQEYKDKLKTIDLDYFKKGNLGGNVANYKERLSLLEYSIKAKGAQGITVNAKTLVAIMAYKDLNFTVENAKVSVHGLTDKVIIDYWPLNLEIMESELVATKGGFENKGKGTPEGDGKDKAMRKVADGFIGDEPIRSGTSTQFSRDEILSRKDLPDRPKITMLARNFRLRGEPLKDKTKSLILNAYKLGSEFVVGDAPNVDSQFIDYLDEIGAKYTVYHTGSSPRISVRSLTRRKIEAEGDNIIKRGNEYFLETTKEHELALLVQAAVDNEGFGLINALPLSKNISLASFVLGRIFKVENASYKDLLPQLRAIYKVFNYSADRRGINRDTGKAYSFDENLSNSNRLYRRYYYDNGEVRTPNEIATLVSREADLNIKKENQKGLIKNLSISANLTPLEELLSALAFRYSRLRQANLLGGVEYTNPLMVTPEKYIWAHARALRGSEKTEGLNIELARELQEVLDTGNAVKAKEIMKGIEVGQVLASQFYAVHEKAKRERTRPGMEAKPVEFKFDYSKEFKEGFIDKLWDNYKKLPDLTKKWATFRFLAGAKTVSKTGKETTVSGVLTLLPTYFMEDNILRTYLQKVADHLYLKESQEIMASGGTTTRMPEIARRLEQLKDKYCQ